MAGNLYKALKFNFDHISLIGTFIAFLRKII